MTTIHDHRSQDAIALVPLPLSDDYDHDWYRHPSGRTGPPDPTDPTDLAQVWGHCADFCIATDDVRTDGLTVAEHGLWCTSRGTELIDSRDAETGRRVSLHASVVRPYLHGTYHRTAVWRRPHHEQVQLTFDDDDVTRVVNLDVGDALRLAAALTQVCAVADRLDRDFNDARRQRQATR